jgi:hypothetical protein
MSIDSRNEGIAERDRAPLVAEDRSTNEEHRQGLSTADVAAAGERSASRNIKNPDVQTEPRTAGPAPVAEPTAPLFSPEEARNFQSRWDAIQVGFVDEPRRVVEQADGLVAEVIQRLAQVFADERAKLEGQFKRGDNVSTEDLRQALRHYRSFFSRLLSV